MKKDMLWLKAIIKVLKEAESPMHYTDITDEIIKKEYRKNVGATPSATVSTYITSDLRQNKDQSLFIPIDRGVYALKATLQSQNDAMITDREDEKSETTAIINAFGMFWKRDLVNWEHKPIKILGQENIKSKKVDFSSQIAVYLLYDGREVIYVGQTQTLGQRLSEHLFDRHRGRWDRFSWFGLKTVSEKGSLEDVEENTKFPTKMIINTLEALLIEGLEPRQNRQQGNGFSGKEFLQVEDTELEKRRQKDLLVRMVKSLEN